ncbi:PIG-L family deacetylase [bacterium]|nr:PIG-L family deacetylase [bacterium]
MKILVFSAHPDDAESSMGGTILKYTEDKNDVLIIHTTSNPVREKEGKKAARILKAKVDFLKYPDTKMPINLQALRKFERIISNFRPDRVYSHWPVDYHIDHQAVGILTIRALNNLESRIKPELYFFEPCTGYQNYYFIPNTYVDVTNYKEKKKEATFCHKSQKPFKFYPIIKTMMKFRGYESGYFYAEAFIKLYFRYSPVRDYVIGEGKEYKEE